MRYHKTAQPIEPECELWNDTSSGNGFADHSGCTPCRRPATCVVVLHYPAHRFKVCEEHALASERTNTFQGREPLGPTRQAETPKP